MKLLFLLQLISPIWAAAFASLEARNDVSFFESHSDVATSSKAGVRGNTTIYAGSGLGISTNGPYFYYIQSRFNIPTATVPKGKKGTFGGAAWPGITGKGGLAQAGAIWTVSDTKPATYAVWVDWPPRGLTILDSLKIKPGDTLNVIISIANNQTQATILLENETTNKIISHILDSPTPDQPLRGVSANWVVEDYTANGLFPFAHFTDVTFLDCIVNQKGPNGMISNYAGAGYPLSMVQNGTILATGDIVGDSSSETVKVHYGK